MLFGQEHVERYQASDGEEGHYWQGALVLLLTTTGRQSGEERTTPLTNIAGVDVTGPYAIWKTAGPARLAITDRGLTFATNGERGVLILFETPVPGLDPLGLIRHPELTVTVADVDGLADLLRARLPSVSHPRRN